MNEVFDNAQRAQYGQSSEKKTYVLNEDQLNFFNEAEDCQNHKAEEPTEETLTVKAHARKKKRTIDELAKNLPVEEIVIALCRDVQHIVNKNTIPSCGVVYLHMGNGTHQFSILDDRRAGHVRVKYRTKNQVNQNTLYVLFFRILLGGSL